MDRLEQVLSFKTIKHQVKRLAVLLCFVENQTASSGTEIRGKKMSLVTHLEMVQKCQLKLLRQFSSLLCPFSK